MSAASNCRQQSARGNPKGCDSQVAVHAVPARHLARAAHLITAPRRPARSALPLGSHQPAGRSNAHADLFMCSTSTVCE